MYKWILSPAMGSDIYRLTVDRLTANTLLAISLTFQVFFLKNGIDYLEMESESPRKGKKRVESE
jgi:hypothetical protein